MKTQININKKTEEVAGITLTHIDLISCLPIEEKMERNFGSYLKLALEDLVLAGIVRFHEKSKRYIHINNRNWTNPPNPKRIQQEPAQ